MFTWWDILVRADSGVPPTSRCGGPMTTKQLAASQDARAG
jgi:hypothetical protein